MAPEDTPGLRTFIEQNLGITLGAELVGRLEEGLGTMIDDDPARWRDVERNLAAAAGDDPDDSATVQPVLERLLDEASSGQPSEPLACLPDWTPGQQAIVATRVIQGEIDNGGAGCLLQRGRHAAG